MHSRMFIVPALIAFVACGGGDASSDNEETPNPAASPANAAPEAAPAEAPAPAAEEDSGALKPDADGIVRLEGNDMMQYNSDRIEVEGLQVKIELKHVGVMEKRIMGHNLVVLTPGTDAVAWANAAAGAEATEFIPEGSTEVIAHTKLLGGGESDTIEFEVPGPGEYPFVCSFRGHAAVMKGVLIVK